MRNGRSGRGRHQCAIHRRRALWSNACIRRRSPQGLWFRCSDRSGQDPGDRASNDSNVIPDAQDSVSRALATPASASSPANASYMTQGLRRRPESETDHKNSKIQHPNLFRAFSSIGKPGHKLWQHHRSSEFRSSIGYGDSIKPRKGTSLSNLALLKSPDVLGNTTPTTSIGKNRSDKVRAGQLLQKLSLVL